MWENKSKLSFQLLKITRERGEDVEEKKKILWKKNKKEKKRERENPLNDHFNLIQTLIGKL